MSFHVSQMRTSAEQSFHAMLPPFTKGTIKLQSPHPHLTFWRNLVRDVLVTFSSLGQNNGHSSEERRFVFAHGFILVHGQLTPGQKQVGREMWQRKWCSTMVARKQRKWGGAGNKNASPRPTSEQRAQL